MGFTGFRGNQSLVLNSNLSSIRGLMGKSSKQLENTTWCEGERTILMCKCEGLGIERESKALNWMNSLEGVQCFGRKEEVAYQRGWSSQWCPVMLRGQLREQELITVFSKMTVVSVLLQNHFSDAIMGVNS